MLLVLDISVCCFTSHTILKFSSLVNVHKHKTFHSSQTLLWAWTWWKTHDFGYLWIQRDVTCISQVTILTSCLRLYLSLPLSLYNSSLCFFSSCFSFTGTEDSECRAMIQRKHTSSGTTARDRLQEIQNLLKKYMFITHWYVIHWSVMAWWSVDSCKMLKN